MKSKLLVIALLISTLSGCAGFKVVPQPVESGTIDLKENSVKVSQKGIAVTAAYEPIELYSQNLTGYVAAFRVTVDNGTASELIMEPDSFMLLDDQNRQYFALMPAKVKELLTKDTYYLIPYPYVGFYYLEDYEKSSFVSRQSSSMPYYYEVHPEELFSKAFSLGPIIPNANVTGLVYFKIDPAEHKQLKLLIYKKGTPKTAPADFTIPFSIQK
jgi:hypothetical protein